MEHIAYGAVCRQCLWDILVNAHLGALPDFNHHAVALFLGEESIGILLLNGEGFLLGLFNNLSFVFGDAHVVNTPGDAGDCRVVKAKILNLV